MKLKNIYATVLALTLLSSTAVGIVNAEDYNILDNNSEVMYEASIECNDSATGGYIDTYIDVATSSSYTDENGNIIHYCIVNKSPISENYAWVTGIYCSDNDNAIIPETIDGYVVKRVDLMHISGKNYVSLTIPDTVVYIDNLRYSSALDIDFYEPVNGYTTDTKNILKDYLPTSCVYVYYYNAVSKDSFSEFYNRVRDYSVLNETVSIDGLTYNLYRSYNGANYAIATGFEETDNKTFELPKEISYNNSTYTVKKFNSQALIDTEGYTINFDGTLDELKSLINTDMFRSTKVTLNATDGSFYSTCINGVYYHLDNGTAVVTKGTSDCVNVTIPKSIVFNDSEYTVNEIKPMAFFKNESLESIDIQAEINTIQKFTFTGCTNLKTANLPASVKTFERAAFAYCTNLCMPFLPVLTKDIEYYAFYYCENIKLAWIPFGVKHIGIDAFSNCIFNGGFKQAIALSAHVARDAFNYTNNLGPDVFAANTGYLDSYYIEDGTVPDMSFMSGSVETAYSDRTLSINTIRIGKDVTSVNIEDINNVNDLKDIYYSGTEEEWNDLIANDDGTVLKDGVELHFSDKWEEQLVKFYEEYLLENEKLIGEYYRDDLLLDLATAKASIIMGDVTCDDNVSVADVVEISKAICGSTKLTAKGNYAADVNGDGSIDSADSLLIMKYVVGLSVSFE